MSLGSKTPLVPVGMGGHAMVGEADAARTAVLSDAQRSFGASPGTVAEIGVHHGAYFAILASLAWPGEPLWVCDLFDSLQEHNLDRSGRGNLTAFRRTVRDYALRDDVHVEVRPSYELHRSHVTPPLPIRLISVDGSHQTLNVFTDLVWTVSNLATGGMIVLDDVASLRWMGPSRAMREFWHLHDRTYQIVPLMLTPKKLWLVQRAWHAVYAPVAFGVVRRNVSFQVFWKCMNVHEPSMEGTVDYAPLSPPSPQPNVRVGLDGCDKRPT